MEIPSQKEALLRHFNLYYPLTEDDKTIIASFFRAECFSEGSFLFNSDRVCKDLYFIVSGIVRIISINSQGEEITYFFIGPGQICTILESFLSNTITDNAIQASSNVEVLIIGRNNYAALCSKLSFFSGMIDRINQNRLLEKVKLKNSYSGLDATERYRLFLKLQADVAHKVPLNHIATYLGVTPQSLSRIRKILR